MIRFVMTDAFADADRVRRYYDANTRLFSQPRTRHRGDHSPRGVGPGRDEPPAGDGLRRRPGDRSCQARGRGDRPRAARGGSWVGSRRQPLPNRRARVHSRHRHHHQRRQADLAPSTVEARGLAASVVLHAGRLLQSGQPNWSRPIWPLRSNRSCTRRPPRRSSASAPGSCDSAGVLIVCDDFHGWRRARCRSPRRALARSLSAWLDGRQPGVIRGGQRSWRDAPASRTRRRLISVPTSKSDGRETTRSHC